MNATLVLVKKDGSHKSFALPSKVTMLGRRHDCDLYIPLPTVSRRHCQINTNNEHIKIRDLESRAGTFVNGKKITEETTIKAGDQIQIGPLLFILQIDGKPENISISPPAKTTPKPAKLDAGKTDSIKMAPQEDDFLDDSFADIKVDDDLGDIDLDDSVIDADELGSSLDDLDLDDLKEV